MQQAKHNTTPRSRRRPRLASRSARSRGAVIVLALLGAFMIAGMIGYAFNTGRHAQLRQQTQHAADATAITGAGYVARSFNTVAMNNVEISRLIAVVQMLDSVPLAVEYTLLDVEATLKRVQEQGDLCPLSDKLIDRMVDDIDDFKDPFGYIADDLRSRLPRLGSQITGMANDVMEDIERDLENQIRQLEEMDEFFNQGNYDVREMTFYDSEFGRGELWKAMESLDAISMATMEHLGELKQVTAIETGLRNMRGDGGETIAAVAPFEDGIYWQRYAFDDFRDPVVRGRLPRWVDDRVTNRGPYDTIFGWRSLQREAIEEPNPDYVASDTPSRFGSRWSGGSGGGGRRTITTGHRNIGYTTYGPWQWLADIVRSRIDSHEVLYESQFTTRMNRMAGNKLNMLWPGSAQQWVFLDPQWITDFDQAEEIIAARTPRAAYTQFIRFFFNTHFTYLPQDRSLLNAIGASAAVRVGAVRDRWDIIRPRGGWTDVQGAFKACSHVWDDGAVTVTGPPSDMRSRGGDDPHETQRLQPSPNLRSYVSALRSNPNYVVYKRNGQELEAGDPVEEAVSVKYPVVRIDVDIVRFVWAGMNVGPPITIRDPNNFASRSDLPAPVDFDHAAMIRPIDGAVGRPGSPFTFLGIAKQPNTPQMWQQLFDTSAFDGHAGIAQASVFNNHSWDLWTQMWHAQLEPVQNYDQWIDLMQSQVGAASGFRGLSTGELQETIDYLQSLEQLAPVMLNH